METVQLRRYVMEPGRLADFLAWFPSLVPVREQYGFRLVFGLADEEREVFTWAVAHDGDAEAFLAAEQVYNAAPERARVFETFPDGIADKTIGFARPVP
jgi:hypothetical protein